MPFFDKLPIHTNQRGASSLVELLVAGLLAAITYFSFTEMFRKDHANIVRLETRWEAQMMAESITNLIASMTTTALLKQIDSASGPNKIIPGQIHLIQSTPTPKATDQKWMTSWRDSSPRIYDISFEFKLFDKDGSEKAFTCPPLLDRERCLDMYHKQIITRVEFAEYADTAKGPAPRLTTTWQKWIYAKEFPD